jgi:predicted transcriptional regulator
MRRGLFEIYVDIMRALQEKPLIATRLMYKTNLNYDKLKEYLDYIESKGFIHSFIGNETKTWKGRKATCVTYALTDKGRSELSKIESLQLLTEMLQ